MTENTEKYKIGHLTENISKWWIQGLRMRPCLITGAVWNGQMAVPDGDPGESHPQVWASCSETPNRCRNWSKILIYRFCTDWYTYWLSLVIISSLQLKVECGLWRSSPCAEVRVSPHVAYKGLYASRQESRGSVSPLVAMRYYVIRK